MLAVMYMQLFSDKLCVYWNEFEYVYPCRLHWDMWGLTDLRQVIYSIFPNSDITVTEAEQITRKLSLFKRALWRAKPAPFRQNLASWIQRVRQEYFIFVPWRCKIAGKIFLDKITGNRTPKRNKIGNKLLVIWSVK